MSGCEDSILSHDSNKPLCPVHWLRCVLCVLALSALGGKAGAQGYYQVRKGESLDTIARQFRVSVYEIAKANRITVNSRVAPGSRIYVPKGTRKASPVTAPVRSARPAAPATPSRSTPATAVGTIVVKRGDSLWALAQKYSTTVNDLARANGLASNAGLEIGQKLRLPGAASARTATSSSASRAPSEQTPETQTPPRPAVSSPSPPAPSQSRSTPKVSSRGYTWPVDGRLLRKFADSFREKHAGIDIAVPLGTEVRAANNGTVVFAGKITTYGRMIIVQHTGGLATCYAYNSLILVDENDRVKRGQVIARSGDPGKGDEAYLHFQMRKNGEAIDPLPWLP